MRLVYWLLALCFFTSSFDVFLIFDIGGQVRISQILLLLLCIAATAKVLQDGRILWARGSTMLILWLLTQFIFLPMSGAIAVGLQYFVLTAFTIISVLAVIQLFGRSFHLEPVMRVYLWSFVCVAIYGLFQFVFPLFNVRMPFTTQFIVHNRLARINGFTYEPSYYVTYMMLGWIMLVDLRRSNAHIVSGNKWKWLSYAVTASLILSTSRTGWIIMFVELVARTLPWLAASLRSVFHQSAKGQLLITLPRRNLVAGSIVLTIAVTFGAYGLLKIIPPTALLQGTGLAGTAAHSYNGRTAAAVITFEAFMDHPFVGRSLGGVSSSIASRSGNTVHNIFESRVYQGYPIPLELLVASGVFAFIPVLFYVYRNTFGAFRLAHAHWPNEHARWLRALARAMIFECLMLCTDQSIIRVYVWLHLTMIMLVAYNLEFVHSPQTAAAAQPSSSLYPPLEPVSVP